MSDLPPPPAGYKVVGQPEAAPNIPAPPQGYTQSLTASDPGFASQLATNKWDMLQSNEVDSPDQSARVIGTLKAGISPKTQQQIKFFAQSRGIPEARYGVDREGNIVYLNDKGQLVREVPSVTGATGPVDFLRRLGANVGFGAGASLPTAAGAGAAVLSGMGPWSIPAAAGAAAATDAARQAAANYMASDPLGNLDYANMAGHAALAAGGQTAAFGLNKLVNRNPLAAGMDVKRMTPAALNDVESRINAAKASGITVTPGEAMPAGNSLLIRQRQLGRDLDSGASDILSQFYDNRRNVQVPQAFQAMAGRLSPQASAAVGARNMQAGAQATIDSAIEARKVAARPVYEKALSPVELDATGNPVINPKTGQPLPRMPFWSEQADELLKRPAMQQGLAYAKKIAAEEGQADRLLVPTYENGKLVGKTIAPDWRSWDYIKRGLDSVLDDNTDQFGQLTAYGQAVAATKRELLGMLDKANSDYPAARAAFAGLSPEVQALKDGLVGVAAGDRAGGYQNVPRAFLGIAQSDPLATAAARRAFDRAGQMDAWNAGVRSYLTNAFDAAQKVKGNPANTFYQSLYADPRQKAVLKAAMSGDQWDAFDGLMQHLEMVARQPAEGSPTSTDLGAAKAFAGSTAKAIATTVKGLDPFNIPTMAGNAIMRASTLSNMNDVATLITNPDAVKELRKLRMLSPGSQKAAQIIAQAAAKAGVSGVKSLTGAGQPDEQMPAALGSP